jgi:hypothetical protein
MSSKNARLERLEALVNPVEKPPAPFHVVDMEYGDSEETVAARISAYKQENRVKPHHNIFFLTHYR